MRSEGREGEGRGGVARPGLASHGSDSCARRVQTGACASAQGPHPSGAGSENATRGSVGRVAMSGSCLAFWTPSSATTMWRGFFRLLRWALLLVLLSAALADALAVTPPTGKLVYAMLRACRRDDAPASPAPLLPVIRYARRRQRDDMKRALCN